MYLYTEKKFQIRKMEILDKCSFYDFKNSIALENLCNIIISLELTNKVFKFQYLLFVSFLTHYF